MEYDIARPDSNFRFDGKHRAQPLQNRFAMNAIFAFALGLGLVAGLRSLTPPAVVAWTAHLG